MLPRRSPRPLRAALLARRGESPAAIGFRAALLRVFVCLALIGASAGAAPLFISSPDTAQTCALSSILYQRLRPLPGGGLAASITFSNVDYASRTEPRDDERFDFGLPGVSFDGPTGQYLAKDGDGKLWPVAAVQPQLIGKRIVLAPGAHVVVAKVHGRVSVTLVANPNAAWGEPWIETSQPNRLLRTR